MFLFEDVLLCVLVSSWDILRDCAMVLLLKVKAWYDGMRYSEIRKSELLLFSQILVISLEIKEM